MAEWERPSLSSGTNAKSGKSRSKKPHRLRWAIGIAALVAAVGFGWVSWSAYKSGGAGSDGAMVPLLKADSEPTRIRPDDPGGMTVPNQDKTIYDELDPKRAAPKGVERLLPPPEAPISRPAAASAEAPNDQAKASGGKPSIPSLGETGQQAPREVRTPVVKGPKEPEPAPAPPQSAAVPSPFTKLEAPPRTPSKPAPSAAPAATTKAPAGVRIQLGAVGTEGAAQKEWDRIRRANGDLLGSISPAIVRADLGAKGVVYRIQAGPLASRDSAADLCAKLKARNVGCFVAR